MNRRADVSPQHAVHVPPAMRDSYTERGRLLKAVNDLDEDLIGDEHQLGVWNRGMNRLGDFEALSFGRPMSSMTTSGSQRFSDNGIDLFATPP